MTADQFEQRVQAKNLDHVKPDAEEGNQPLISAYGFNFQEPNTEPQEAEPRTGVPEHWLFRDDV